MGHGGKRAGAGRPVGAKSKATAEAKEALELLAQEHTQTALETLAQVCAASENDAARVSAATALLDRGYGKPKQTHDTNLTMTAGAAFVKMLKAVHEQRSRAPLEKEDAASPPLH